MRVSAADASRRRDAQRRWTGLLVLSAAFHALVLGAFALRLPEIRAYAETPAIDVSLVAPRFTPPPVATRPAPRPAPSPARVTVLPVAPRYAGPPQAATGEASDAADLFGPVFADGQWPRPILVKSEPCDPHDDRAADCRRDLMLMGVAPDAAGGAKPGP